MSDDFDLVTGDVRVRVSGLRQTIRAMEKAGSDAQDMRNLMHEVGMIVVNHSSAPVRTGALSASVRAGRGKTKAVVRAGGAAVPYAGVIHYGWPARGIAPNPFLVNAIQATQNQTLTRLDQGLGEILRNNNLK